MDSDRLLLWIAFNVFVLGMLAVDLGIFHRKAHAVSIKEATTWSVVWIALAMIFNLGIYYTWGQEKALEFLTGYVIEKSLSVDNLFVFLMIFQYFATPAEYQHRVLFWGILGALVMRGLMIGVGVVVIREFEWVLYAMGGFLLFSGTKMMFAGDEDVDPERNIVLRFVRKVYPVSAQFEGSHFLTRLNGRRALTPLALVLLSVETTDLIFAIDSIPAIFGVTNNGFIIFTSNVFAILGLRSLYFVLAGALGYFRYLKAGLALVLVFIGVKMLLDPHEAPPRWFQADISTSLSLATVGAIIVASMVISLAAARREAQREKRKPTGGDS